MSETIENPDIKIETGKIFINGEWRESSSGETFETINPANEEVITSVAKGTEEDANAAVTAAREAFDNGPWGKMGGKERSKVLLRIADKIDEHADELIMRESMDAGKLKRDVTHVDVPHIANMFRYYAGWTTKIDGSVKEPEGVLGENLLGYTRQEPLGIVTGISPYNFPLILSVSKIAPALAAGNCFIHKPASLTPLSAITLAKIMQEAGVPNGAYNLVTGPGGPVGGTFVKHPDVNKIAITGSTETGIRIAKDAADTMKHLTMELGGKSPNIIFEDADLDEAARIAAMGIFWNKGEVCVAGARILVQESVYDKFLEKLVEATSKMKVGDPMDETSDLGPMAGKAEFEKVLKYIDIAKNQDKADLVYGGEPAPVNGKGYYVTPTIFANANNQMRFVREEIFGPVVPVIPFKDFDEAIKIANDTPFGLAAGVQTRDTAKAIRAANLIKAGTIWLNTWHEYDPNMPFGGYKMSGYGREQGKEAFEAYTQTKSIWVGLGK